MKHSYANRSILSRITSWTLAFSMVFTMANPWSNLVFAIPAAPSFVSAETQADAPGTPETKASLTLTVDSLPTDSESFAIGTCTVTFATGPGATTDDTDCSDLAATIDTNLGAGNTDRTPTEIAASLASIAFLSDAAHGSLSLSASGSDLIAVTAWAESSATNISQNLSGMTGSGITLTYAVSGVVAVPAEARVVDFTPGITVWDRTVYRATIDGTNYHFAATGGTLIANIVTKITNDVNSNTGSLVTCADNVTKMTCTANTPGITFASSSEVIDKNTLFTTLNAEYSDGSARTALILSEADYSSGSWADYMTAINTAKSVETDESATTAQVDSAVAGIATSKAALSLVTFANWYLISNNSTADAHIDTAAYSGSVYAAYDRDGKVYLKMNAWAEGLVGTGSSPAIAIGSDGTLAMLYLNGGLKYRKLAPGGSWSAESDVVWTALTYDVDVDALGYAHVVYDDGGTGGRWHVVYVSENPDGSWSAPVIELTGYYDSGNGNYYHNPKIKIDPNGKYHVVYEQDNWGGLASWSERAIVVTSNAAGGSASKGWYGWNAGVSWGNNAFVLNGSNIARFVYSYGGSLYQVTISGDSWSETNLGTGYNSPALASDGASAFWLSYTDGAGAIRYKRDAGAGFIGSTVIEAGASASSVIMDWSGNSYVYYVKSDGNDDEVNLKSTVAIYTVPGSIATSSGSFVFSTGSVGLAGLDIGASYELTNGSGRVSSGVLVATASTGSLSLDPSFFVNFWRYSLTLSGSKDASLSSNLDTESYFVGPVDYEALFHSIGSSLASWGIANNLSGVTYADVTDYIWLYFEKIGYGKVLFGIGLNLTNSGTQTLLQDLPNQLDMSGGYIDFDPTGSDLANHGAQLTMNFATGSTFVTGISDPSGFVVRSSTGALIDANDVLSGIHGACEVLGACLVTFDTDHFTNFDLRPIVTYATITSDSTLPGILAIAGDTVSLAFSGSETLTGVTVTIGGQPAAVVWGGDSWTATRMLSGVETVSGSGVTFSIDYRDLNGNTGATVSATTDSSTVTVDFDHPDASVAYSTTGATNQSVTATLTGATEDILVTNNSGSGVYVFASNGSFEFEFQDAAGNTGAVTATVTNIDTAIPAIQFAYSSTGATNRSVTATGTTTKSVTLTSSGGFVQVSGTTFVRTFSENGGWTVVFEDAAGNTGSGTATVANIDTVPPTADITYSTTGATNQSVTATLTGASESVTIVNNSGSFTHVFAANGDFEFQFQDAAGNTGAVTATVANIDTVPPSASVEYSAVNLTNQDVTATLTGASETLTGTLTHVFAANGTYALNFADLAGNTGAVTATVTNIDKASPAVSALRVSDIVQTGATVSFDFSESNFSGNSGSVIAYTGGIVSQVAEVGATSFSYSGSAGTGSSVFSHLDIETDYTYAVRVQDDAGNVGTSTGTFSTPNDVSSSYSGWTVTQTGATSFTGASVPQGQSFSLSGTNIRIESDPSDGNFLTGSLTVSGSNLVVASGSWNGILLPPSMIDDSDGDSATGSEIGSGVTVIQTIRTGAENASLTSTWGGYFYISFVVPGYSSGTTLFIYRSNDGTVWTKSSPDETCTLDANRLCSFRSDHLTSFAAVLDAVPDAFVFSALTNAELSTAYDSDSISVAGINTGSTISISGGTYRIGSGSFVSDAGTVQAGDTVTVRLTSSSSYSTLASATLTIGGVGATFGVTTKSSPASGGGGSGGYGIPIRYSVNANSSGSVIPAVTPADASGTTVTMTAGAPIVRFTDISDSFARAYIERLVASGAVSGASDTYRPEAPATRAEFLKIALVGLGIVIGTGSTSANFSDVKEAWMVPYVEKAFELGIISGQVKDGKKIFRPNDFISRAEALKIVLNAGEIAIPETKANSFSDVSESWMIPYVERALQLRIISGQTVNGKKSFRPNDSISRAEVAKIVVNVMDIPVSDR